MDIYMRLAVFHDNIFPQQSMFPMHLFDLISNLHFLSLHPLDVTVETICQETKSPKDAWHNDPLPCARCKPRQSINESNHPGSFL